MNSFMVPAAAVYHSRFVALLVPLPRVRDDRRQVDCRQRVVLRLEAHREHPVRVIGEANEERTGADAKPDLLEHVTRYALQAVPEVRLKPTHELRNRPSHRPVVRIRTHRVNRLTSNRSQNPSD
jgi:hypothetical protein